MSTHDLHSVLSSVGFKELMDIRNGPDLSDDEVTITGADPLYTSPFRIGETAAAALAARGVAANDLWELRNGYRQTVSVDVKAAAATSLYGGDMTQRRDEQGVYQPIPYSDAMKHMVSMTQPWRARDGRWLLPHTNLAHLERRILDVIDCESSVASIRDGIGMRDAAELEDAIAEAFACGGLVRTPKEWLEHPHGAYLASRPVVEITRINDTAPEPMPPAAKPLSGVRVLDLTRILAGPTAGLGMAEHGADVLMVTAPHLPQVPSFVRDTSHGKRSCYLDIGKADEAERLYELVKDSDVFIDGYRPNRLAAAGFGANELIALRPGLVHVTVNCFGSGGPFASRAGWDQVAQAVTGICHTQGEALSAAEPKLTPVFMCDFLTGFLAAFGAMVALARRAREGGSYRVQVSLCQSAMFLQRQGLIDNFQGAPNRLSPEEFEPLAVLDNGTAYGDLKTLGPVLKMSETPCVWSGTTPALGSSEAVWLTRG